MDKNKVKQLVREAVNKSPPLKNYLEINHIYGKYISKSTDIFNRYFINMDIDSLSKAKDTIEMYIHGPRPISFIGCLRKHDVFISTMKDIYNN